MPLLLLPPRRPCCLIPAFFLCLRQALTTDTRLDRTETHHTRHSVSTYTVYYTSQFFAQSQVGTTTPISQPRKANVRDFGILRIIVTKRSVRTQVWVSSF